MLIFWIYFIVFTSFYLAVSIALFMHSHNHYVISRSPTILQISHWANLSDLIMNLVIIYSDQLNLPKTSPAIYWIIDACLYFSQSLMIFCYIIRAYRLYIVFNIDLLKISESTEFIQVRQRATQRWMITALIAIVSPLILIFAIIYLVLLTTKNSLGLFEHGDYGKRSLIHYMIFAFYDFLLQLAMIIMMYLIRFVRNEFQMLKEMISVTIIINAVNFFSIVIHSDRDFLFIDVGRNLVLMIISSLGPIILSYIRTDRFEIMSMDMLNSIDLIVQHPVTLNSFEEFLKEYENGEGLAYLELFFSCECYFDEPDELTLKGIFEKMENESIDAPRFYADPLAKWSEVDLHPLHEYCLDVLELDYYPAYKISRQCDALRMYIYRHEIFSNRLSQTSFLPVGIDMQKNMVSLVSFYQN